MAWEWSHTPEAYESARENLSNLPHDELVEIYAEWNAERGNTSRMYAKLDTLAHHLGILRAEKMSPESIVEAVWPRIEELRTCDNGGHNAWVCPYGCHTVPFSLTPDKE